jgi:hypothetical protein
MVNTNRAYRPVEQQDFIVTDMTLSQIAEYIQELIAEWGPTATVAERWHPFEEESYLAVMTTRPETDREWQQRVFWEERKHWEQLQRIYPSV